ncbi:MAG: hypothetical protein ACOC1P_04110 [Minisyncoccales bacterium]
MHIKIPILRKKWNGERERLSRAQKRSIKIREKARKNKNYSLSDEIRRCMEFSGIKIIDKPSGTSYLTPFKESYVLEYKIININLLFKILFNKMYSRYYFNPRFYGGDKSFLSKFYKIIGLRKI